MRKILLLLMLGVIGLSANAQITFIKTYGGLGRDQGRSVQQTTDGGYIIVGYANLGFDTISHRDTRNVYLIKTNSYGDTLWTKTYGTSKHPSNESSVKQTTDGGYIIIGSYLIKTNSSGDTLWTNSTIEGNSIQQTTDGGYIITGLTTYGIGLTNVSLIKTNSNGTILWNKTYGGTNLDVGYSVQQTTDGGYIINGVTTSFGEGSTDVYLIKTDSLGNYIWSKSYGRVYYDDGCSVQQTFDSGYIITGFTSSVDTIDGRHVLLIKTNSLGDTLWTKTYGGSQSEYGYSVQQTTDSGYIVAGCTSSFGAGDFDVYLIKTNSNGDTLWTRTFGGIYNDEAYSVQQTSDGGYIFTGYSESYGLDTDAILLIKTDANGNVGCSEGSTATITFPPVSVITNPATIVSASGIFISDTLIIGNGANVTTVCTSAGIPLTENYNSISLYPNPTSGSFTIKTDLRFMNYDLLITDVTGREVYTQASRFNRDNQQSTTINVSNLSNGIYFYQLTNGTETYRGKFVKE